MLRTLRGHTSQVRSVAFSPDDRLLVSGDGAGDIRIWDLESGLSLRTIKFEQGTPQVLAIAFSPDGDRLAAGGNTSNAYIWDVTSGELLHSFESHTSDVNDIAFTPDGTGLLTGSRDGVAYLWDANDDNVIQGTFGSSVPIAAVDVSADGTRIALGDEEGASVWDVDSGQRVAQLESSNSTTDIVDVAFTSDGSQLVTARSLVAELWDIESATLLRAFEGHTVMVSAVAAASGGEQIVTGGGRGDDSIRFWALNTRQPQRSFGLNEPSVAVAAVAYSPDGSVVALGECAPERAAVRLLDASSGDQVNLFEGFISDLGQVECVPYLDISADGNTLLGGNGVEVRLIDIASGDVQQTLQPHSYAVDSVSFSADGSQVLTAGGDNNPASCTENCGSARLWDSSTGEEVAAFVHPNRVSAAALSPDGAYLVTGDAFTGDVRLWATSYPDAPIITLHGHTQAVAAVAFSADGSQFISGSRDGTAILWDRETASFLLSFVHGSGDQRVVNLEFADGQPWVVATAGQTAYVWDTTTGTLRFAVSQSGNLADADFAPDTSTLLTGGADNQAHLWQVAD